MDLSLRLLAECRYCDGHLEDHRDDCPFHALKLFVSSLAFQFHICPGCRDTRVRTNKADFFECPKCNTIYSSGIGADGRPPMVVLKADLSGHAVVVKLPEKGRGDFKDIEVIKSLRDAMKRRLRERAQ